MKIVYISILLFLTCNLSYGQKTYLKVQLSKDKTNVVYYPPGTQFELKNKHGYTLLKYSETPKVYKIDEEHTLYVYPNYKENAEKFKLKPGSRVELALTKNFGKERRKNIVINKYAINAYKKVFNSEKIKGKKNLEFELTNGVKFEYIDGKYNASLKGKYLDIKGKYLIKSKLGLLRLSFNPTSGEVWWIFEKDN